MKRPYGYVIPPHVHNPTPYEVSYTSEVLLIKSGRVRVDFYTADQHYLESSVFERGDVILIAFCCHGFEMLEESEIIEVKQGPYIGDKDKTQFNGISKSQIRIRKKT